MEKQIPINSVCVYCSMSSPVNDEFRRIAGEVGNALAKQKIKIIYGGSRLGLMGSVANAALAAGGEVIGILPGFIREREIEHQGLTKLYIVNSMHERKQMMTDLSDAFIILPGGFGTLDEAFEALSWKKLGLHNKPVIIFNYRGFWTPLLEMISRMHSEGFIKQRELKSFLVVESIEEMLKEFAMA